MVTKLSSFLKSNLFILIAIPLVLSFWGVWAITRSTSPTQVFNKILETPTLSSDSVSIPGKILSVSDSKAFSTSKDETDYLLNLDSYNFDKNKITELKKYLIDASVKKWATSNNEAEYRKSEESRMNLDPGNPNGQSIDFYLMNRFAETSLVAEDKVFYSPVKVVRKDKMFYTLEITPPKSDYNYNLMDFQIHKGYQEPIKILKENIKFTDLSCVATRVNGMNIILIAPRGYDKNKAGSNTLDSTNVSCNLANLNPSKKYYVDYYQRFIKNFRGSDDAIEFNRSYWMEIIEGY
jgi:hypothetical protein